MYRKKRRYKEKKRGQGKKGRHATAQPTNKKEEQKKKSFRGRNASTRSRPGKRKKERKEKKGRKKERKETKPSQKREFRYRLGPDEPRQVFPNVRLTPERRNEAKKNILARYRSGPTDVHLRRYFDVCKGSVLIRRIE